jgi:uncharacterized NAD(P)/FAD-binding protein YdhS
MQNIVIVGGGLSSRLLIIQLLEAARDQPFKLTVIEKESPERLGDAFCTDKEYHLLNVPVSKLSAFPERPCDLLEWLTVQGYGYGGNSFIPRNVYKRYIVAAVDREVRLNGRNVQLCFLQGEVCDIDRENRTVMLSCSTQIEADKVILALGNFPPAAPTSGTCDYENCPGYYKSAWQNHLFSGLGPAEPVLIIGTGLTMVDVVLMLQERRHTGHILALSHHGFVPVVHKQTGIYPPFFHELEDLATAIEVFRVIKAHICKARQSGIDWRAVIDSLRPFTHEIWRNLPPAEKDKFMEHLRHLWGVARHRMAPENAVRIDSLIRNGRLRIIAGRIITIKGIAANKFLVEFMERGLKEIRLLPVNAIVNCMGPASNYNKIAQPLLKNLLKKGLIQVDEMRLGIDCLPDGSVIGKNGRPSDFLFTLGPPMKGVLWESTAIPEIRSQAQRLAHGKITKLLKPEILNSQP